MKGILIGILSVSALCLLAHENPLHVFQILIHGSLGSAEDLSTTLFYATHLMFCAVGMCLAFQTDLFPIGAEGQLSLACLATACLGLILPNYFPTIILVLIIGPIMAALLGAVTAYFKIYKNSHEVIVTMMFNFLCAGLANYLVSQHFQNPNSQNPETTPLAQNYLLFPSLFHLGSSPANWTFFLAIAVCVLTWIFLYKTKYGFEIRAVGLNSSVASHSGISKVKIYFLILILGGFLTGLGSWNQILGYSLKYQIGFSADYGFLAIAVALVASNNPLLVIPASLFFAILLKGAADLDVETDNITRDFVKIIQALLIFSFMISQKWSWKEKKNA